MGSEKADIWFAMYPGDYLKDTLDLTLEEDAFYSRALNQVYIGRGRIPADPARLQRLLRVTPAQFNRCRHILERYLYRDGDFYGSRRADIEIAKALEKSSKASEKGRRGNEKRWGSHRPPIPDPTGIATAIATAIPEPSHKDRSSPSPSDPPYSPPTEFRKAFPILCQAFGVESPSHRDEMTMFETWCELRAKKATNKELRKRIARYREIWPEMPCTPNAILKHWHTCKPLEKPIPVPEDDIIPDSLLEDSDD